MEIRYDAIREHIAKPPVDIKQMAIDLGLALSEVPFAADVSGKLAREGEGFRIYVNAHHGENRKRFTIAHEIAHFLLHQDLIRDEVVDSELYRSDQIQGRYETQANSLAADLLMPQNLVDQSYSQFVSSGIESDDLLSRMAELFQVSKDAMRIRLKVVKQLSFPW